MWNAATISSYVSALNDNLGSMDVSYVHGILSEEERWDGCVSSLLKYMNIFRGCTWTYLEDMVFWLEMINYIKSDTAQIEWSGYIMLVVK